MSLSRRHSKGEGRRRRGEINGRRAIVVRDMPGHVSERWGSVSPELERDYNSAAVCRRGHAETMAIEFRDEETSKRCAICGAEVLTACEECGSRIRGNLAGMGGLHAARFLRHVWISSSLVEPAGQDLPTPRHPRRLRNPASRKASCTRAA